MGEITESEWSMQNEPLLRRQKRDVVKDGRSTASLLPGHQDLAPNSDATLSAFGPANSGAYCTVSSFMIVVRYGCGKYKPTL